MPTIEIERYAKLKKRKYPLNECRWGFMDNNDGLTYSLISVDPEGNVEDLKPKVEFYTMTVTEGELEALKNGSYL